MPTVNGASLREELDACQERFRTLCRQERVDPECRALIDGLLILMRLMLTVLMEKTTRRGSGNSGLPSSQTPPDETAVGRPGTRGKGPDREVRDSADVRKVTETTVSTVAGCSGCGRDLSGVECSGHERRTLKDIVFEIRTEHVEAEIRICPDCGTETRGAFPDTMPGPLRYGHGIVAFATHLLCAQMVPLRRVAQTVKALVGTAVAEATLLAWIRRLHEALAEWEERARARLLAAPVLHVDETSIRIEGRKHWLHSCSAGDLTLAFCHPKRGSVAMDDIGIIPRHEGTLVHDRWASCLTYDGCDHAFCGSHLLRDLQFIIDSNGHAWARSMKRLLKETARRVRESPDRMLSEPELKALRKRCRTILTGGRRELPEPPPRLGGRRGRIAKSDAENLHAAFTCQEACFLRFARSPEVPFTNNRSERDIRMAKVRQKISGCFRSHRYAVAWCRISSYLKSMGYKGYNPMTAIQIALMGKAAEMA